MYLYGGVKDNCDPNEHLYRLDMRTFKWELVEQLGEVPLPRDEHTGNLYQNSLITFGGFVEGERTNQIHKFNFSNSKWETVKSTSKICPEPRAGHSAVIYKDLLIIFGGKNEEN